jgi:hypothetical protein
MMEQTGVAKEDDHFQKTFLKTALVQFLLSGIL